MGARRMLLAAVVGAAILGGASLTTEGCGSVPADVDGAAQDATLDNIDAGIDWNFDGAINSDGYVLFPCPDAGYYFTINGDGDAQTLHNVAAQYFECCGYSALSIFAWPDGGAGGVRFEQACSKNPDGGLTFHPGPDDVTYWRSDGTTFAAGWDASLMTVYTEVDPPGGFVEGSYTVATVTSTQPDGATLSLSGAFFTCRIADDFCSCPPPPHP